LPCVAGTLGVVLDGEGLNLLAPEGVGGFGDRHAFAGAGIEDGYGAGRRRQRGQGPLQRRLVGGEVAVTNEVARQARKHECHGFLLVMDEGRRARAARMPVGMAHATRRSGAFAASSYCVAPRVPLRISAPNAFVSAGTSRASRWPSSGPRAKGRPVSIRRVCNSASTVSRQWSSSGSGQVSCTSVHSRSSR